ncbi:cofactor-independent phosphoglycerate mutase [Petroclostridium sp. X23]|uniref:cofactor-independent phosphoglycerate mutase n=1 Tax=Petroclostridium sp. X23 TaxID=3045146 RepID=UPI0024AE5D86|nr:cofactor-independent phosphoglycerate mutase [Petroclostridium sp. X23]WHH61425.1 cofactor-independent phosphoglycerate mutase [Petroclostridium sp. X23]
MKYIVILGDGMADTPVEQLGGKTPLQYANIPTIDDLAKHGQLGMVKTVPDDIAPGSDVANLSVMGYNPYEYYTGRSPLEAASMGVPLSDSDITFRCNLVTLSEEEPYSEKVMIDYSSDEISTSEATEIISCIDEHLRTEIIKFYPGISYRHLMVWQNGPYEFNLTPPHDILERKISNYLPKGPHSQIILDMMEKSSELLKNHPVNIKRMEEGLRPANSIWIWGEGKKPALSSFYQKYKIKGAVISAVDLIKGIGICAGLKSIDVEGATGNIHTNFAGKAEAAVKELKNGQDFVYVHIEAPDECGHRYEIENKVKSIELIDQHVVKVIKDELDAIGEDYKIMILPDHPTPLKLRTHTSDPVPFIIYNSRDNKYCESVEGYDEFSAKKTGIYFPEGYKLMDYFISE